VVVGPAGEQRTTALRMAAGRLGIDVVEVTAPPVEPTTFADHGTLAEWATGVALSLEATPEDAVVASGPDTSLAAACLARSLGVAYHPPSSVALTFDRARTRQAFFREGVPHAEFRVLRPGEDVAHLARLVGIPCAVKPCVALGRVAGLRAVDEEEAVGALHVSRSILRRRGFDEVDLVVERCVLGLEVVVVGWVTAGRFDPVLVFDKPDNAQHPHLGDELLVAPTALSAGQREEAIRVCGSVVDAVGLTDGPVSVDLCVDTLFVRVLELRSSWPISLHAVEIADGVTMEDMELAAALGMETGPALSGTVVVLDVVAPAEGQLAGVCGLSDASGIPSVQAVIRLEPDGVAVAPPPESDRPIVRIVSRADMRPVAAEAARSARSCLEVLVHS
jgi:formate-dependent phosphoribosylglycinamide formyltransferase (GAR transformylase)